VVQFLYAAKRLDGIGNFLRSNPMSGFERWTDHLSLQCFLNKRRYPYHSKKSLSSGKVEIVEISEKALVVTLNSFQGLVTL
jgi:hypothetical protein